MVRIWQRVAILCVVLAAMALLRMSGLTGYLSIAMIKEQRDALLHFVQERYLLSVLVYIGLYVGGVALSLPVGAILTLLAGFLFGSIPGAVYANIGATIGAIGAFLAVRYLVGTPLQKKYKYQLATFNSYVERYGSTFLLVIHLVAIVPFFLINALAALTPISLWTFIWTTSLGILPGAVVFTFAGQQLQDIERISDVFSAPVIAAFVLLASLALLPLLISKRLRRSI